jgi:hypothetical protein
MIRFARIPSFRNAFLVGALALSIFAQVTAPVAEASRIRQVDLQVNEVGFNKRQVKPGEVTPIIVRARNNGPEFSSGRVDVLISREFAISSVNGGGMNCVTKADHFIESPIWKVSCTRSPIGMGNAGGEKILITTRTPQTPGDYTIIASVTAFHTEDTNPDNNSFANTLKVTRTPGGP